MKRIGIYLVPLVMAVIAVTIFAGCATLEKSEVSNVEGLLTKAGKMSTRGDSKEKKGQKQLLTGLPQ